MSKEENSGEMGAQDAATSDAPSKDSNADIYDNRGPKKIIRVVTVIAYLFSVSFVGILLSAYYLFLWEPPNPRLIQRERLQAEPQVQLLIAEPFSENTDVRGKEDFLRGNEPNRTYKYFQGRIAHGMYDGDPDEINLATSRQNRINAMVLQLRSTLVDALRARNRSLSRETVNNESDNLFVEMEEMLNLMEKMDRSADNSISTQTANNNSDLRPEFADFASAMTVERNTPSILKSTSIFETEPSQSFDGKLVPDTDQPPMPIVERGNEKQKYKRRSKPAGEQKSIHEYGNARMNNDATSNSNQLALEDNNFHGVIEKLPKTQLDILRNKEESTERDKLGASRTIDVERKDSNEDKRTIATSEVRTGDRMSRFLPTNAAVNSSARNYSGNNERLSHSRIGQIARDRVSIDSPRASGFTDDPGFHQPPDDTIVKRVSYAAGNPEGERILANSLGIPDPMPKDKHGRESCPYDYTMNVASSRDFATSA